MRYRLSGPTGLRVSELFLGAMTFGEQGGDGDQPGNTLDSSMATTHSSQLMPGSA